MKLLYISVYKDGTDYSQAAIQNILSCEAAGIDVVCRPVTLTRANEKKPTPIDHLENKDLKDIDVVVQHVLPNMYEYISGVKNVGFLDWSTDNFVLSNNWTKSCNLMDEIWVPCKNGKECAIKSGVIVPIKVIPRGCDITRFDKDIEPFSVLPSKSSKMLFYTVTELARHDNIAGLLRTYYYTFSRRDDVCLVINARIPGKSNQEIQSKIQQLINDIKKSIHIYKDPKKYPSVITINEHLDQEKMDKLHKSCRVFVSVERAGSWNRHAQDAMGFDNLVIGSDCGGLHDLLEGFQQGLSKQHMPFFVDGQLTPCFGVTEGFTDLYTGKEMWFEPNLKSLSKAMETLYHAWKNQSITEFATIGKTHIEKMYSYDTIGRIIGGTLK